MRRRYRWAFVFIVLFCVVAIALLSRETFFQLPADKIQRDFELKAHHELIESVRQNDWRLGAFSSDGCSGGLSTAWRAVSDIFPIFAKAHEKIPPWEHCCVSHDRLYHSAGGATEANKSYALRLSADHALRNCVIGTAKRRSEYLSTKYGLTENQIHAAYEAIANAMFDAVRVGGFPCSGLAWRWGYGYPQCPSTTATP